MLASRLLDKAVVVRELMPQDLKIEIDQLTLASKQQALHAIWRASSGARALLWPPDDADTEPTPGLAFRFGEKP